ncbi:hypothetical protein HOY82DRAFT_602569 [Tuber indicum]|nr:hypothetical protein HOY82DRAFT_602569 [Tuber indicum]
MSSTAFPLATPRKELTIALLGSPSTGKTNFINRKIHNVFTVLYTPTLGDTYTTILRNYPNTVLTIIDLGGHGDVESMRKVVSPPINDDASFHKTQHVAAHESSAKQIKMLLGEMSAFFTPSLTDVV